MRRGFPMRKSALTLAGGAALLLISGAAQATTVYTSNPSLSAFYSSSYATLSNYFAGDIGPSTYTPTNATLNSGFRVYSGGAITGLTTSNNWILASFAGPTARIRVFPNMDHLGAQYDGYQYTIAGSNNKTTWTQLFNVQTVAGSGEPFTLGTFTGTAPYRVNNVITPGSGPAGIVGYIADFNFGAAYQYYAFGASNVAFAQFNSDQELSAVGSIPEASTWLMMVLGFAGIGLAGYRKSKNAAWATG